MLDPTTFSLPYYLQDLPVEVAVRFQRAKYKVLINEYLDFIARMVWTGYEPECHVMMACFTHRPEIWTLFAHFRPTVASARAQIHSSSLFEDTGRKNIALSVLVDNILFDSGSLDNGDEGAILPQEEL